MIPAGTVVFERWGNDEVRSWEELCDIFPADKRITNVDWTLDSQRINSESEFRKQNIIWVMLHDQSNEYDGERGFVVQTKDVIVIL